MEFIYRLFGLPRFSQQKQVKNFLFCMGTFLGATVCLSLDHNKKAYDFLHQNLLKNGGQFPLFAAIIVGIVGFLTLRRIFCNYSSDSQKHLHGITSHENVSPEHNPFSDNSNLNRLNNEDNDFIELAHLDDKPITNSSTSEKSKTSINDSFNSSLTIFS